MQRKTQRRRPYFGVGNKVQLKPEERFTGNALKGLHGTIRGIEQIPDLQIFTLETQEEWEEFLRIRSVRFWVKLDDFPKLDEYYKQNEVMFRYRELRPLQPRIGKQQLAQYCKERFLKEQNEYRRDAYLGVMRYLNGEWPGWPLSSLNTPAPKGYSVDLMNRFVNGATQIQKLARESRERDKANGLAEIYEIQVQVCDEICHQLMPK